MKRATSFKQKRQTLLRAAKSRGKGSTRQVVFSSEAVPEFLESLKKYQEESRKICILAR